MREHWFESNLADSMTDAHIWKEIHEIMDDFSQRDLVALFAHAAGIGSWEDCLDITRSSMSGLLRQREALIKAFKLMVKQEQIIHRIFVDGLGPQMDELREYFNQGCQEDYSI